MFSSSQTGNRTCVWDCLKLDPNCLSSCLSLVFYSVGRTIYTFLDVLITDVLGLIYRNHRQKPHFPPNFSDTFILVFPSGIRMTSVIANSYLLSSYCVLNVGQKAFDLHDPSSDLRKPFGAGAIASPFTALKSYMVSTKIFFKRYLKEILICCITISKLGFLIVTFE